MQIYGSRYNYNSAGRKSVPLLIACFGFLLITRSVLGQGAAWDVYLDDANPTQYAVAQYANLDAVLAQAFQQLQQEGYYLAEVDSMDRYEGGGGRLYITRGVQAEVIRIDFLGDRGFEGDQLRSLLQTRPGQVLEADLLEGDIKALLAHYTSQGFPLAEVEVRDVQMAQDSTGKNGLAVSLHIAPGDSLVLGRFELAGASRTQPLFAELTTGIQPGQSVTQSMQAIQELMMASGVFQFVDEPGIYVEQGRAVVVVPVVEAAPGVFDLVLGYQPAGTSGSAQGLVGNGHLEVRNLFGKGRSLALRLHRLPGQVSQVEFRARDPYIANLPFTIELGFDGVQQDSSYGQQGLIGGLGYRFRDGLEMTLLASKETTRPGLTGLAIQNGRQRVPRSEAFFAGFRVRYARLDNLLNPSRGFWVETQLERGRKSRNLAEVTPAGDTTDVSNVVRRQRLLAEAGWVVPTFGKQVLVLGTEARVQVSNAYDPEDLFRFGGANTLRGYDEDRFRGRVVGRLFSEYRYRIDRLSYAYLFFDLGYVDRPATVDFPADQTYHAGYGLGIQFDSGIGMVNLSFALSTEEGPSQTRVHAGLSLGL